MEKRDIHNDTWLEPWSRDWAHVFLLEKQRIIGALTHGVSVTHVGSTSIEGMPAKPIIDILVCPEKDVPLESCIPKLERIGYRSLGDGGRPGRYFLSCGDEPGRTFYLHLCYADHPTAKDQRLFQKLLRDNERIRARYRYTKHLLELTFPDDRTMYREMKGLFIDSMLAGYRQAKIDMKENETT